MNRFIPLSTPNFMGNESEYVNKALLQKWVSTGGTYITEFEDSLATYLHIDNIAACQSGTAALHLSLVESGILPGDMVIVPTLTFIAAVNPVKYQFAEPVFIDCDDSLCIDPIKIKCFCEEECKFNDEKLIHKKSSRHVKAIIVVHVFGNMVDMESIMEIAGKFNLKVIEDATEALGTYYTRGKYKGKFAGTIGDFGAYSFNGNKIITTGGGGAITSNDSKVVDHLRYLTTQSKDDSLFYVHNEIGFNYRMTNLQAALGVAQMEKLPEFVERKNKNYKLYMSLFQDFEFGKLLSFREGTYSNRWFYSIEVDIYKVKKTMRDIIVLLENKGVQTRAVWGLIHEQRPYKNAFTFRVEKASYYSSCVLNLPSSTHITEKEIRYVVMQVKAVFKELTKD